jgi:hypothetical protein
MKKTFVEITALNTVDYNLPISFLGSCFSESISEKAKIHSFDVESNPLGVVFNPISLGDFLLGLKDKSWNCNIIKRKDIYFSWEANSSVFGYSESELHAKIENSRLNFEKQLSKSSTLFITFGTAWVYELIESSQVVANCHKFDQNLFHKRLLAISEITLKWSEVIEFLMSQYPDLNIIFTLSPVRHIKDGLIENARGKAILLESVHQLVERYENCHYFPAYEIVLDELRDYGFYSKDGLHPNEIAIDEVWSSFFESVLTPEAKKIAIEWMEVLKLLNHKIQYDETEEAQKFLDFRTRQLADFKSKYPNIKLNY